MPKLTKSYIESLVRPEAGKQTIHWDSVQGGLGLRVTNGSKSFIFQQRINGKSPRVTIGAWEDMSVDDARDRARKLAVLVDDGINPRQQMKKDADMSVTLSVVYLRFKSERPLKDRTKFDYDYYVSHYFSDWVNKPLAEIDSDMVMARYKKISLDSGPAQGSVAMRFLRSVINFARATYGSAIFTENPVSSITAKKAWVKNMPKTDHLRMHEINPFLVATRKLENPIMAMYLEFILLTGSRRTEAATLRWADVDFKAKTFTFSDTKNNTNRVMPITSRVSTVLDNLLKIKMGIYVFATVGKAGKVTHISAPHKSITKVNQLADTEVTVHGLRRTYATVLESLDCPTYPLKALLGHSMNGDVTTSHYTQINVERLRPWADKYEAKILQLLSKEDR